MREPAKVLTTHNGQLWYLRPLQIPLYRTWALSLQCLHFPLLIPLVKKRYNRINGCISPVF